jgi:hypothetical protein
MTRRRIVQDTELETARIQFSILREIGAAGRAEMAAELSDGLRAIIESGIRQRHPEPEYDDNMVRLGAIRLAIGEKLFHQYYAEAKVRI